MSVNADPEDESWIGCELKPKFPVPLQYLYKDVTYFLVPIGYPVSSHLTEPLIEQPGAYISDGRGCMNILEFRNYLTAELNELIDPLKKIYSCEYQADGMIYKSNVAVVNSLIYLNLYPIDLIVLLHHLKYKLS